MSNVLMSNIGRMAKDRSFISDEPLRNATLDGQVGVMVTVRLTSYRALPLSCIEAVTLSIDGRPFNSADIRLIVNYTTYTLTELPALSKVWWFILDYAEIFAPLASFLSPGLHDVEGTLVTVEPYITAGRFSFHNSSKKRLPVESADNGRTS